MTTASDIKRIIDNNLKCVGIDDWIDRVLTPMFLETNGGEILVPYTMISEIGWSDVGFAPTDAISWVLC